MRTHRVLIVVVLAAFASLAFAGIQDKPPAGPPHMGMMQTCLMKMPGVDVAFEDTANGIAMTFTAKSGDVADLRLRVERMAKMHENMMMTFTAKYEEIPNGARLTLIPNDPGRLEEFRKMIRRGGMMGGMK